MENNVRMWRRAVAAASVSLLLIVPLLTSAQVSNDPLGRQIVDRIFAHLCARGILKSARCQPPPPAPATLTLVKTVVNDNGGTATSSAFIIHLHQMVGESLVDVPGSPQPGSAA